MMATGTALMANAKKVIKLTRSLYQDNHLTKKLETTSIRMSGQLMGDNIEESQPFQAKSMYTQRHP